MQTGCTLFIPTCVVLLLSSLLDYPHPQSVGTIKLQCWVGTHKRPPPKKASDCEITCVLERNYQLNGYGRICATT